MPMTAAISVNHQRYRNTKITFVNEFKLRDDVEPDVGKLILEHLKEHGQ
jgi:hypothetical protein